MTHSRSDIHRLLAEIGRRPRKSLGQNFVADPNLVRRIARLSGAQAGDTVIEVGAGLGSLTLALEELRTHVIAIEIDHALVEKLRTIVDPSLVSIVEADVMKIDWTPLLRDMDRVTMVGNLPYNIATPLIADLLDGVPAIDRMVVMVQREVGQRLVARVGDDQYGIPSVKVAYWADAKLLGTVPPDVFVPKPNVESALVQIVRRPTVEAVDTDVLFTLVRAGFGQRRKMLRRSLAALVTEDELRDAGINPQQRAEEVDVDGWCRLARSVGPRRGGR
jgi:16S rRNA (adenine1518-N6/adenine1519-N6)-dimethyltransferase